MKFINLAEKFYVRLTRVKRNLYIAGEDGRTDMARTRLVVIGGGFAGAIIARRLQRDFAVTLIDSKDYFEFTPGVLRCLVEPAHIRKVQALHTHYLHEAKVVRGTAEALREHEVVVDGKPIPFDYAAICTGSSYHLPFKQANLVRHLRAGTLRDAAAVLHKAKSVLIIGGGLVGVELAAEIAWKYPRKRVTIVHAMPALIERNHPRAQKIAERFLRKRGVQLVFNELVQPGEGPTFSTNTGRTFTPDLAFLCTGITPNAALLRPHLAGAVTERGQIKVNAHLQVEGFPRLFAAGDVNGILEEKTAQSAELQAGVVVHNLRALEAGRPMRTYRSKSRPMDLSLGKFNGIVMFKSVNISGLIPAFGKWFIERWTMRRYAGKFF